MFKFLWHLTKVPCWCCLIESHCGQILTSKQIWSFKCSLETNCPLWVSIILSIMRAMNSVELTSSSKIYLTYWEILNRSATLRWISWVFIYAWLSSLASWSHFCFNWIAFIVALEIPVYISNFSPLFWASREESLFWSSSSISSSSSFCS
jgi:hypothetical protein